VAASKPAARARVTSPAPIDTNAIAEVKRAVPNLESMSLADATQTLRVAALKEYAETTEAMERAVQQAEQRVIAAQNSGNEADRQAAVKQLQQVQNVHTEKLKKIAARLQGQIEALKQIKEKPAR
jgi:copper homeostasis protein CutC